MDPGSASGEEALGRVQMPGTLSGTTVEDVDSPGEPACWAHLVCPQCGGVLTEGHSPGCEVRSMLLR